MRQIINHKMYDTETAKYVGDYSNALGRGDFRYEKEELYLKKTGEFFLAGEGGPLTKYAEDTGFGMDSGYGIIPLDEDEARDWVEQHMSPSSYIELFGMPEE